MKILVTGTAGFIGYHLAKKLLELGHEIIGYDNINDYYDVNLKYARLNELGIAKVKIENKKLIISSLNSKHKFIKADLEDSNTLNKLFEEEKFDAVCNLAAQAGVRYSIENPHAYIQSNVVGFMNILEACRNYGVKKLSYASSSSVYVRDYSTVKQLIKQDMAFQKRIITLQKVLLEQLQLLLSTVEKLNKLREFQSNSYLLQKILNQFLLGIKYLIIGSSISVK